MCQTVILNPSKDISQLNRNEIACKINYCSVGKECCSFFFEAVFFMYLRTL